MALASSYQMRVRILKVEDLGIDVDIPDVDWIILARDRVQRRTTVHTFVLHVTAEKSACLYEMLLIFYISIRCCLLFASHKISRTVEMQDNKIQDGFQKP
jgi:hypothetical protein